MNPAALLPIPGVSALGVLGVREFWEYIIHEERAERPKGDLLPIASIENRALYVRLAAYAMIGAAAKKDQGHLIRLTTHQYGLVARAAAIRLVRLLGERALRKLSTRVDDSVQKRESESLAGALQSAEIELFRIASLW